MNVNIHSLQPARFAALCLAICLVTAVGRLHAQSDFVFMTADIDPGNDSKLIRFDLGSESFTTDTGGDDAFLGVTVLSGEMLVADYVSEQIQRFAPDGTYFGPFASSILATFLESDSNGNVYTTPYSLGPIFGVNYATRFNSAGVVTGTFSHPSINQYTGIDADTNGNVFVVGSSGDSSSLYKFASNGTFLNSIPVAASARDVSIDEVNNRLYIAHEFDAPGIQIYDISAAIPFFSGAIATPAGSNIVGIHYASESGNILATDFGAGSGDPRGLEFSPTGTLLAEYRPANAELAWDITTFVVIPEPSSLILLLAGTLGLGFSAGRRR